LFSHGFSLIVFRARPTASEQSLASCWLIERSFPTCGARSPAVGIRSRSGARRRLICSFCAVVCLASYWCFRLSDGKIGDCLRPSSASPRLGALVLFS
jgi:hypothetical protein